MDGRDCRSLLLIRARNFGEILLPRPKGPFFYHLLANLGGGSRSNYSMASLLLLVPNLPPSYLLRNLAVRDRNTTVPGTYKYGVSHFGTSTVRSTIGTPRTPRRYGRSAVLYSRSTRTVPVLPASGGTGTVLLVPTLYSLESSRYG